jgi:hypothetical protein
MLYGAAAQTNGQTILTNIPSPLLVCLVDIPLAMTTQLQDLSGNLLSATLQEKQNWKSIFQLKSTSTFFKHSL